MAQEDKKFEANKYLEEGLNLYGLGMFAEAIEKWKKVLEIDPDNSAARDYIESAGGDAKSVPHSAELPQQEPPAFADSDTAESFLREARGLAQSGKYEAALELLEKSLEADPDNMETHSLYEMVKGKQLKNYIKEAGQPGRIPVLLKRPQELLKFNLTKEAGFIISLIDGQVTLDDIVSLSGMDKFSTYSNLVKLKRLGVIS